MEQGLLIKYGEIAIKGKNRSSFENLLIQNIKAALKPFGKFWVDKEQGRLFVRVPENESPLEMIPALQKVFGIWGISIVDFLDDNSVEALGDALVSYVYREYQNGHTFKVEVRRADKNYPLTSMELASILGGQVLERTKGWKVDVHTPEIRLMVELRNKVYIYGKTYPGIGGMPVGSAGKGCLLLSGGIDSPVAGYMMAKRGLSFCAVYYHAHPYTSERAKDKVIKLAHIVSQYAGPIHLYVVPFTQIQLDIYEKCPHDELTIIMRRAMMRIAEKIAQKEKAGCLITGESLGQVASQTMESLNCTNAVCDLPVFRPVIGMDKLEIIDIAHKIGTFETSILPYEDCCTIFVAKHPVTHPERAKIENSELLLPDLDDKIDQAVKESERILI